MQQGFEQKFSEAGRSGQPTLVVVERPPPGIARGLYPAPAWLLLLVGGGLIVFTLLSVFFRFKKSRPS